MRDLTSVLRGAAALPGTFFAPPQSMLFRPLVTLDRKDPAALGAAPDGGGGEGPISLRGASLSTRDGAPIFCLLFGGDHNFPGPNEGGLVTGLGLRLRTATGRGSETFWGSISFTTEAEDGFDLLNEFEDWRLFKMDTAL